MLETILTIVGVAIGFALSVAYERHKGRTLRQHVKTLLSREIRSGVERLRTELEVLRSLLEPPGMPPVGIEELASRVERSVERLAWRPSSQIFTPYPQSR